jgi:hypothetical protein
MSGTDTDSSSPARPGPPGGDPPPAPSAWVDHGPAGAGTRTPHARRPVGWGLAMIAVGALWLLSLVGVPIRWELLLPGALTVVGVLVLARPRGVGSGLIGLGVVLLVLTLVTSILPGTPPVSAGDRTHTVSDVADLRDDYRLGAGTLVLDLGDLAFTEPTEVAARVGMGELVVVVPEDVRVEGRARAGMGEVEIFGDANGGVAPVVDLDDGAANAPLLTLDLQVGLGQIEVRR